jgi:hypothetical protein
LSDDAATELDTTPIARPMAATTRNTDLRVNIDSLLGSRDGLNAK